MRLAHILVCHTTDPTKAIESIPHEDGALWYVFLHSPDTAIESAVERLMQPRGGNIFSYRENRGLARSWNDALHLATEAGCAASILLNDDLFFYEGGYRAFRATIEALRRMSRTIAYMTPLGLEAGASPMSGQIIPQHFACCAIMPECIEKIGYFDETYTPAYNEDTDYYRRIVLSGMSVHVLKDLIVEHERSATSRAIDDLAKADLSKAKERNSEYFYRKWGHDESFKTPFNQSDLTCMIPFERRRAPY